MATTSSEAPPSSPRETPTINNSTESKPLENADPKGKKPLENNHYNAPSSGEITNEEHNHGGALPLSSEMIHKDVRLLDSAQPSLSKSMGVSTSSEAPPSSPTKTPTINKSSTKTKSKTKSKGSIWSFVANLAKVFFTKPKPLENNPHNAASSSGITNEDDNHGGVLPLSSEMIPNDLLRVNSDLEKYIDRMEINKASKEFKELRLKSSSSETALSHSSEMIQKDLLLLESALTKYMHHTNEKINQVCEKFKELLKLRSSGTDHFDEVRRAIKKLEDQIPSLENNHHNVASSSGTINEDDNHGGAPSSETDHFDVVRRAIRKLEDQIPLLENNHHNAASSSGTTNEDDNHGGALSHSSEMIQKDLLLLDLALMEYMHHTNEKINEASKDFEELRLKSSSSETDHFDKVRKAITKLKGQIPLHRSSDSKSQHKEWPNINGAEEGMTHFLYKEPEDEQTGDMGGQRDEAFRALSEPLRCCLLCFFKFPRKEFIRITTMIYLWIGQGYVSLHLKNREGSPQEREEELPLEENAGKKIFDELIAKNFIERCSSVPNSCRMRLSVRSSLYKEAESKGFATSNGALDLDRGFDCGGLDGRLCLINVGEAIINNKLEFFEKMKNIRSLHLGRWQNSAKHHIELEDIKFLDGVLEKQGSLTFLSLRGISLIKELPESILKLNDLKILDLRACQNLEVIPKNISLLKNLTHLDMSECYFLEHMPESLALLSNLEVLKGFFIGHVKNKKQSCTLNDLSELPKLRKLNIYTSVKEFPTSSDLGALRKFEGLLKLTISWGGCSSKDGKNDGMTTDSGAEGQTLHLTLLKLDLQGFPMKSLPHWLRPANLKELKKLYIRGGNLCDLGQLQERPGEKWKVEILRLKYLSELKIDEDKLRSLFPELIYLHQVKSRDDKSGVSDVWMDEEALDTRFWLQKFFKTDGSLSSLERYGPNLAQG